MSAGEPTRHVVLAGLMGVGKTTVGRLLAANLGWPLADSDEQIQALEGATVREIQERSGAAALHRLEARILLAALAPAEPSVVCAAASTIDDAPCRAAMSAPGVVTVWLAARLSTLVARYDSDPHRPRYPQGTRAALAEQRAAREPRFRSVAAATVAVDGLAPEAIVTAILPAIGERSR